MAKKKSLDWKYCECGCHCHEVIVNSTNFQLYNDLRGGYYLGINTW